MSAVAVRETPVDDDDDAHQQQRQKRTPLPKFQLFVVFFAQFSEPITAIVIYPFINQFVQDTGITNGDPRKIGYYAGILESAFFLTETLTVFQWGYLSDRLGRRPILLLGPLGLTFAMLGFGLSKTFWPLVIYRCFQGVFNGNIGVAKTVIGEITDPTNIADAFSLFPLVWGTGTTLGSIIGGVFTSPSDTWPDTFGRIRLLREHPYLLPCMVAACIAFAAFLTTFIFLKETSPAAIQRQKIKKHQHHLSRQPSHTTTLLDHSDSRDYGTNGASVPGDLEPAHVAPPVKPPPLSALLVRPLLMTFSSYAFLCFVDMSYSVLLPLICFTPISLGGLGMSPYQIGTMMGGVGLVNAFVQVTMRGYWVRKFGARKTFITAFSLYLLSFSAYPIAIFLARRKVGMGTNVGLIVLSQLVSKLSTSTCYGSMHVLIVENCPSKASLGSTNGIGQTISSGMRCVAPTIASSLFSISLQQNIAGGNLVFIVFFGIILAGIWTSFLLPIKTI
ncbi:major facilitator superfamily multidrug-resistance, DHA1 sub-family [Laccaria bicolor S238N-H82]|uniref:Major facilitator superfamily multidrug-resistance, DHA1 sub-family n=1 Tax=Laccaria bicolor (strain S238N-H82 / ATCC MYA-4686) TaxID=486041 RepID=B0CZ17_LACBS|nr:major facilitator superfamily multidrug-resistance, DHA1 sub-family [Laccaria bicolor S238N-H82]EDR12983.1 major facilitator superfamily multidrug-resistance, DHA1 sub-family [Laccaria bicolor S238N-H82]|eukprot:XP_001877247.1 major facilitator superfamily multidrug-resistance, DHA1 sub-family [Laccaria bicolor S238N-H82]